MSDNKEIETTNETLSETSNETANETSQESETTSETTSETKQPVSSFLDLITDEDLKSSKSLSNFKDINGLAKSYINLEKKLGAPKEPEKYEAEQYKIEDIDESDKILNTIKDKAISMGLNPDNFKELVKTFKDQENEIIKQIEADNNTRIKEMEENLSQEWGNEYESNLKLADQTWQQFAPAEYDKLLENLPKDAQLAIAKTMFNIGSKVSNKSIGKLANNVDMTKQDALESIELIKKDTSLSEDQKQQKLFSLYNIAYS